MSDLQSGAPTLRTTASRWLERHKIQQRQNVEKRHWLALSIRVGLGCSFLEQNKRCGHVADSTTTNDSANTAHSKAARNYAASFFI